MGENQTTGGVPDLPQAPLDMPRQALERERGGSVLSLLSVLFAKNA